MRAPRRDQIVRMTPRLESRNADYGLPHVGDVDLLTGRGAGGVLGTAALVFFAFLGFRVLDTGWSGA
jgi:hypothetical protein